MKYSEFESIISPERMRKYNVACGGNTAKAMTLYRYNLRLSQEMFVVVSCFEIALRNRIDQIMRSQWGNDWLRDSIQPGGMLYSDKRVEPTKKKIEKAYNELAKNISIHTLNYSRKWNLDYGNICLLMSSTGSLVEFFYEFSQTSRNPAKVLDLTTLMYLANWTISTI